jgi:hypothetical protein
MDPTDARMSRRSVAQIDAAERAGQPGLPDIGHDQFDPYVPPVSARRLDPRHVRLGDEQTSHDAAKASTPAKRVHRSRLRAEILRIHQAHPGGLTDDELVQLLEDEHPAGSAVKRRGDLVRDGELRDSERTRRTRFGSAATVFVV